MTSLKIANDPIKLLLDLVEQRYPYVKAEIWFNDRMKSPGLTLFKKGHKPIIKLNYSIPYYAVVEVLAHELAHAIVGIKQRHNEVWRKTFKDIFELYDKEISRQQKKERRRRR